MLVGAGIALPARGIDFNGIVPYSYYYYYYIHIYTYIYVQIHMHLGRSAHPQPTATAILATPHVRDILGAQSCPACPFP
jgi:hypothetical protein